MPYLINYQFSEGLLYPIITFESDSIRQDSNRLNVTGTLKFHGVSRNISFEAEKNNTDNRLEVKGSFIVKMTQFNIEPPSLMGMATDDDILIAFKVSY